MRWLNEPTPASPRIATGGPPTPFFRTILMTPPIALSPYSTAPLLPRGDFNALDQIARNGREIDAGHVDVVEPSAVDEHQGI